MTASDPRSLSVNFSSFTSNGKPSQIKSIVGDVRSSILTEAQFLSQVGQGWVLADGQDVTGSPYETLTGNATVPDMRGRFPRGLDTSGTVDLDGSGRSLGDAQDEKTAIPSAGLSTNSTGSHSHTGSTGTDGNHRHALTNFRNGLVTNPGDQQSVMDYSSGQSFNTTYSGDHSHSLSIDSASNHSHTVSGGDNETRPKNISVNFFIYIGF